ncbi:MAG: hypothetical protein ACLUUO_14885 [Sellimonas intestinalis]
MTLGGGADDKSRNRKSQMRDAGAVWTAATKDFGKKPSALTVRIQFTVSAGEPKDS